MGLLHSVSLFDYKSTGRSPTGGGVTERSSKNWKNITNYITTSRSKNYKLFSSMNIPQNSICTPSNDNIVGDSGSILKIKVKDRIGSESSYAVVYKISLKIFKNKKQTKVVAASKIIPKLSSDSIDIINNEINIAKILSNAVRKKETKFFPLVYKVCECNNTIYPNINIYNKPEIQDYVFEKYLTEDNKQSVRKYMVENNITNDSTISKLIISKLRKQNTTINIPSTILISELAWGDLRMYIKNKSTATIPLLTDQILIEIIKDIIRAIIVMQKYNIIHNDLHTGNVLMLFRKINTSFKIIPLVHDFDKSIIVNQLEDTDYCVDLLNILRVILYEINHTKPMFKDSIKYIKSLQSLISLRSDKQNIIVECLTAF